MADTITIRDIAPQQVLSITQHVLIGGLGELLRDSLARLHVLVNDQGGEVAGAPFGIYHGRVDSDEDGPIEICLPVTAEVIPEGEVVYHLVDACRVATIHLTGERCRFPTILTSYYALHDWIIHQGYEIAGPPWEIWIRADDEIELAWPLRERSTTTERARTI